MQRIQLINLEPECDTHTHRWSFSHSSLSNSSKLRDSHMHIHLRAFLSEVCLPAYTTHALLYVSGCLHRRRFLHGPLHRIVVPLSSKQVRFYIWIMTESVCVCVFSFVFMCSLCVCVVCLCVRNVDVGKSFPDHTWREIVTNPMIKHTHKCTKLAQSFRSNVRQLSPSHTTITITTAQIVCTISIRNVFVCRFADNVGNRLSTNSSAVEHK